MKTALTAAFAALLAVPAAAQGTGGTVLSFDLGIGARSVPTYLGSSDHELQPWPILRSLNISTSGAADDDGGGAQGFSFGPDFAFVPRRKTDDSAPERLRGLDDIGYGLELGLQAGYRSGPFRLYTGARKAVGGHKGITGEVGVSYAFQPADRWSVISSLEAQYGNRTYMDAYFGVSAAEAARSGLAAYDAAGGLTAYAATVEARYRATPDWSVLGRLQAKRLQGDAARSPVVEDRDQLSVGIGVVRSFNFRF